MRDPATSPGAAEGSGVSGGAARGWYPDPLGRFVQRYFDGIQWTDAVSNGQGWTGRDSAAARGPGPGRGAADVRPNQVGIVMILIGAAAMLTGVFALPWISTEVGDLSLDEVRTTIAIYAEGHGSDFVEDGADFVRFYVDSGVYVATFGLLAIAMSAAVARASARSLLVRLTVVGGAAAVLCHVVACRDMVEGEAEAIGAGPWMILVGTGMAIVGALIPPSRRRITRW